MPDPTPAPDAPLPDPNDPAAHGRAPVPPQPAPRKKRWGRRIAIGVLVLLLLLCALVLLAPTIASTSPVRRMVLGKINSSINGTVQVQDWSLGWNSGIQARGIKVFDDRHAEVMSVAQFRSGLSLLDAMRGRYHCGDTVIDEPNLEQLIIYPDGSNNVQKIFQSSPTKSPEKSSATEPSPSTTKSEPAAKPQQKEPLDVSGTFTVNRLRGLIQDQRAAEPVIITPDSNATVKIKTLKDPIDHNLMLVFRVGPNGAPGTLKLAGASQAAPNGTVDEKLEVIDVPLAGANPFLALAGHPMALGGTANGSLVMRSTGSTGLFADGQILATQFTATGEPLHGETYASSKLVLPIKLTSVSVDPQTTRIKIESLGVQTDQGTLNVTGDISPEAARHIAENQPPGSDGHITLALNVPDLKSIADQLPRTVHLQNGVKVTGGQFFHETNIWISKDKTVLESKTDLQGVAGTNKGQPVTLSPIHQTVDVTLLPTTTNMPDLHDLALTLVSGFASVDGGGKTLAALDIKGNVDLPKMQKELGQFVDFGKLDLAGTGQFAIRTNGDLTQSASPIKLGTTAQFVNLRVAGLDGAAPIEEPLIAFTADGMLRRDSHEAIQGVDQLAAALNVGAKDAPMLAATLQNGRIDLPPKQADKTHSTSPLELLKAGELAATINLPRAYDLAERFSNPTTRPAGVALAGERDPNNPGKPRTDVPAPGDATVASTAKPLPPLKVVDGVATLHVALAQDAANSLKTFIRNGQVNVDKLVLERGGSRYAPTDQAVALAFAGEVETAAQSQAIRLSSLDGKLFGGTLKMPKPIVLSGPPGKQSAEGGIEMAGKLDQITSLLDTLQAKAAGQGYPYHGDYRITQNVETRNDVLNLTGDGNVTDFTVDDTARKSVAFSEKQVALTNQLSFDSKQKNFNITSLKLDMNGSDALHLALGGSILGVGGRQAFDNLKLTLGYDLEKLWPIVYPMLAPAQQKDLKDAKVAGKFQKIFTVAGSYPAGKPFREAVGSLIVNGSLGVEQFNAMGLDIQKLDLPLALSKGILRTQYTDRPEGQQIPPPAVCNGGQLTLAGPQVDLNGAEPRLATPKDFKLLYNVTINPLLGDNLGKYINPVFTNSERAQGLLDVTIASCDGVALGDAMKSKNSGSAKIFLSLRDMDIANPLMALMVGTLNKVVPSNLLGLLGGGGKGLNLGGGGDPSAPTNVLQGEIKDAVITLDQGVTTQDVTLQLIDPKNKAAQAANVKPMPMHFQGNIQLADLRQNLVVSFPTELLAKYIPDKGVGKTLLDIFPQGVPLTLKGTTTAPKVDAEGFIKQAAGAFQKEKLNQVIGGGKGDKNDSPIGDLIDAFGKKKKKDKNQD